MAEDSRDRLASETGDKIVTELVRYAGFHLAEDYHQKHMLRSYPALMTEFEGKYPLFEDFVSSTAVSRANGYLGGNGTCEGLKSEIAGFGLSKSGEKVLLENVCGGNSGMSCATKKCS